jgi:hypothetical protein
MEVLNKTIRNTFQHFLDDGLSVELSGLPRITRSACDIVEHLALKFRTMGFRLSDYQESSIKKCISTLRANTNAFHHFLPSSSNA